MQLVSALTALILGAVTAAANSVTFISLDDIGRTIQFTASAGYDPIQPVWVAPHSDKRVEIPWGWIGNWYSVSDGRPNIPGMLGEVTFQGWNGLTYFDVSAIVNPNDHEGVKEMYPAQATTYRSGCFVFPCNNAYYMPDDVQTKTTTEVDLICTLGSGSIAKRGEGASVEAGDIVSRNYVLGKL